MASIFISNVHACTFPRRQFPVPSSTLLQSHFRSAGNFLAAASNRSAPSGISGYGVAGKGNAGPSKSVSYTVGDFMTKKENLNVLKPYTTIDEALSILVKKRISGFPVVDDDWNLVGVVSDYDLLALHSIAGGCQSESDIFPDVNSSWKNFKEIQRLLSKTNGEVIADVMTPAPLVVRESTSLENAARLLLETKYHRLPVVDNAGKLVGIITREDVVRAGFHIKQTREETTMS